MTITSIFGYPGAFAFAFTSTLAIAAIHAHPITFSHRPLSPWDRLAVSPFSTKAGGGICQDEPSTGKTSCTTCTGSMRFASRSSCH